MISSIKEFKIETSRLVIRLYQEEDLQECFELMQNKDLFTYLDMDVMPFDEYEELFHWLIRCYDMSPQMDFKYSFNITLKEGGKHIGWCGIGGLPFDHATKEIFYLIGKAYWHKGYAYEAAKALLDFCFAEMELNEIAAVVQPGNIASQRVIEKVGLKYRYILEGLPEEFDWNNGELFYSLTKDEYQKANHASA